MFMFSRCLKLACSPRKGKSSTSQVSATALAREYRSMALYNYIEQRLSLMVFLDQLLNA